jgi:hypothetical protein
MRQFFGARRTGPLAVVIVILAVLAPLGSVWLLGPAQPGNLNFPFVLAVPAILAALVGALSGTPAWMLDRGASRRLWAFRILSLAIPVVLIVCGSLIDTLGEGSEFGPIAGLRNSLGFLGLSLIAAVLLGPKLSWTVPLLWIGVPPFFFFDRSADPVGIFTFYAQPASQSNSLIFAVAVFIVGFIAVVAYAPRDRWFLNQG